MNRNLAAGIIALGALIADIGRGQGTASSATLGNIGANAQITGVGGLSGAAGNGVTVRTTSNAEGTRTVYNDASGSIELNTIGDQKSAVVKTSDGSTVFSGPFESETDRAAAPASVRARVEEVELKVATARANADRRMAEIRQGSGGAAGGGGGTLGTASVSRVGSDGSGSRIGVSDASGRYEISTLNGQKSVTVKNPDGTEIYSGPYNTEAERQAAPEWIRTRIEQLEKQGVGRAGGGGAGAGVGSVSVTTEGRGR